MAAFKEKDMFFQGCKCNKSFCFKGSLEAERFCSADNWMWGIFPGENKSHFSIQNTVKKSLKCDTPECILQYFLLSPLPIKHT